MTKSGPPKASLVILRHGQTDYNKKHLNTGRRDIPLNETGKAQADAVGVLIKAPRFDKVYSSPLSRAFNTAARALKASGTQQHLRKKDGGWKIEKRAEIIELDAGDFTGLSNVDDPEASKPYVYDVQLPNGESMKDVVERVRPFYESEVLPRLERGENVLVSGHYFIVIAFEIIMKFREVPHDGAHLKVPNAAPLVVDFEGGKLKNHRYVQNPRTSANQNKPAKNKKHFKP